MPVDHGRKSLLKIPSRWADVDDDDDKTVGAPGLVESASGSSSDAESCNSGDARLCAMQSHLVAIQNAVTALQQVLTDVMNLIRGANVELESHTARLVALEKTAAIINSMENSVDLLLSSRYTIPLAKGTTPKQEQFDVTGFRKEIQDFKRDMTERLKKQQFHLEEVDSRLSSFAEAVLQIEQDSWATQAHETFVVDVAKLSDFNFKRDVECTGLPFIANVCGLQGYDRNGHLFMVTDCVGAEVKGHWLLARDCIVPALGAQNILWPARCNRCYHEVSSLSGCYVCSQLVSSTVAHDVQPVARGSSVGPSNPTKPTRRGKKKNKVAGDSAKPEPNNDTNVACNVNSECMPFASSRSRDLLEGCAVDPFVDVISLAPGAHGFDAQESRCAEHSLAVGTLAAPELVAHCPDTSPVLSSGGSPGPPPISCSPNGSISLSVSSIHTQDAHCFSAANN